MSVLLKKDVFEIIKSKPVGMTNSFNNFVTTSYILTTKSLLDESISEFTYYDYDKGQLKDFTGKYYVLPSITGYYSRIVDKDTLDKSLLLEFQIGEKFIDADTEFVVLNYPLRKSSDGRIVYFVEVYNSKTNHFEVDIASERYLKALRK